MLVGEGSPLRMGPQVKGKVYTLQQGEWHLSSNDVILPEGWYAVPPSFVSKDTPVKTSK